MTTQCPNCNSYKTKTDKQTVLTTGFAMTLLGLGLSFLFIPLFFVPIGIVLLLSGFFTKAKNVHCQNCSFIFPVK